MKRTNRTWASRREMERAYAHARACGMVSGRSGRSRGGSAVCGVWSTGCRESVTAKSRNGNGSRIDDNQPGGEE
jgi:hypothetical protein